MVEEGAGGPQRERRPEESGLRVREYGRSGPRVILLHGGPGAMGTLAPVARELAAAFRVLEPLQRRSGGPGGGASGQGGEGAPLTVARHVDDLHRVVTGWCGGERPAMLGHSWGAMLALCYAAARPGSARSLVLVGCGTWDRAAREALRAERERRMTPELRARLLGLAAAVPDPDRRLERMGDLFLPVDSVDAVAEPPEPGEVAFDERAYRETWSDMMRLQAEGVYPAVFTAVTGPVLMVHGAGDPHPGRMIEKGLRAFIPHLEYRELDRCGHYPWLERGAREAFFRLVRERLAG